MEEVIALEQFVTSMVNTISSLKDYAKSSRVAISFIS